MDLRVFSRLHLLQVQRSQSVVVVGGGSAGVEMAAEVKTEYPDKEVGEGRRLGLSLAGTLC